jgi:hypothetical protein
MACRRWLWRRVSCRSWTRNCSQLRVKLAGPLEFYRQLCACAVYSQTGVKFSLLCCGSQQSAVAIVGGACVVSVTSVTCHQVWGFKATQDLHQHTHERAHAQTHRSKSPFQLWHTWYAAFRNQLHSTGLCCSCCNVAWFCSPLEARVSWRLL